MTQAGKPNSGLILAIHKLAALAALVILALLVVRAAQTAPLDAAVWIASLTGGLFFVAAAVLAADFLTIPAWIIGGALLWRRRPLGYVAGAGLLFQASMLFVALIIVLLAQPVLTGSPFALADVIVIALFTRRVI